MERLNNKINIEISNDLSEYAKELYKNLLEDVDLYKELIDEGFSNQEIFDHIGLFTDLKENRDLDKKIKSFDDCVKYNHYYYFKVVRKGLNFDKIFYANQFYEDYLKYCGHFIFKDFDNEFNDITFKKAVNKSAKKYIKDNFNEWNWIYLTGALRSGRTYLTIAMCNEYIKREQNSKIAFINCSKRFSQLADMFFNDKETYKQLIESIKNADLVVFDDFGSEYKTISVRDLVVKPILLYRASNNLRTIFTSNFELKDIYKMYKLNSKDDSGLNVLEIKAVLDNKVKNEYCVSTCSLY